MTRFDASWFACACTLENAFTSRVFVIIPWAVAVVFFDFFAGQRTIFTDAEFSFFLEALESLADRQGFAFVLGDAFTLLVLIGTLWTVAIVFVDVGANQTVSLAADAFLTSVEVLHGGWASDSSAGVVGNAFVVGGVVTIDAVTSSSVNFFANHRALFTVAVVSGFFVLAVCWTSNASVLIYASVVVIVKTFGTVAVGSVDWRARQTSLTAADTFFT